MVTRVVRRSLLLDRQAAAHPSVARLAAFARLTAQHSPAIAAAAAARRQRALRLQQQASARWLRGPQRAGERLWRRAWQAHVARRQRLALLAAGLAAGLARVGRTAAARAAEAEPEARAAVLGSARLLLCTIASTSRLVREWEECVGDAEPLVLHTAIVSVCAVPHLSTARIVTDVRSWMQIDECGCTAESSVALLLRLKLRNLILVGDHRQLPP